jgi:hypothetical protein
MPDHLEEQKGTLPAALRPTPLIHKPVKLVLKKQTTSEKQTGSSVRAVLLLQLSGYPMWDWCISSSIHCNLLQSEQAIAGLVQQQAEHCVQKERAGR